MSWIRDKMHPYTTGLLLVPTTAMLTCTSLRSPEDLGLLSQWPVKNRSGRVVLSGHCSQGWVKDFVTILITVVWHVIKIHSMDSICGESDKVFRLFSSAGLWTEYLAGSVSGMELIVLIPVLLCVKLLIQRLVRSWCHESVRSKASIPRPPEQNWSFFRDLDSLCFTPNETKCLCYENMFKQRISELGS